jgi:ADP-ribosylglycohydrolase
MQSYNKVDALLIGLALGDAHGMPFEMLSRKDVRKHKKNSNYDMNRNFFVDIPDFHFLKRDLNKAEVTDDTILTKHFGEYLLDSKGEIDKEDYFSSLGKFINNKKLIKKGIIGPSTSRSVNKILRNDNLKISERAGISNGLTLKATVLAYFLPLESKKMNLEKIKELAYYSHYTDTAISAAAGVYAALAEALSGNSLDQIFSSALSYMKSGEKYGIQTFYPSVYKRTNFLFKYINDFKKNESLDFIADVMGTGINSYESVVSALAIFKLYPESSEQALSAAVDIGGDTDSIAALVGALVGAKNGIDIFKRSWIEELNLVNSLSLIKLGRALYALR